ncbi:hypothetical protein LVB87_15410 [Lysobacter sp. KIS68-7]|uniref:hypothetical protein n=1 Tax=Lysobacter sp. KIS68-7 TaxID=2904252 RepID=UPI001E3D4B91|nr:hypothetical protein [Lysobacter sp. KIS68-7]UHQ19554.1 hypothetical protein LVB87_15410 [Lysobacter sp. KIS68-7]
MSYSIALLPEPAVIQVTFAGVVTPHERSAALDGLIREQARSSYERLLVDFTQADVAEASNAETIDHATRMARGPAVKRMRIACVGDVAISASVEALAALRGYYYQRFGATVPAIRWLARAA